MFSFFIFGLAHLSLLLTNNLDVFVVLELLRVVRAKTRSRLRFILCRARDPGDVFRTESVGSQNTRSQGILCRGVLGMCKLVLHVMQPIYLLF